MLRDDLFTVVHEQFMTDTARLADIVLPATTQLEQVDLHKPYGQRHLQYNHAAIAPLAEAKSNWDVSRLLATAMGYDEPWLHDEPEEVLREILDASRPKNPTLDGITLERLQAEGTVAYAFPDEDFGAVRRWPLPDALRQGRAALRGHRRARSRSAARLPAARRVRCRAGARRGGQPPLVLITGAAHHFVTTSMANQPGLVAKEGTPFIEINPDDAAARQVVHGRGCHRLERARVVHAARRRHRRRAPRRNRLPQRPLGLALRGPPQRQLAHPGRHRRSRRPEHLSLESGPRPPGDDWSPPKPFRSNC